MTDPTWQSTDAPRWNSPPNWPSPPAGWTPPEGWQPDPAWGPAPNGWEFWIGPLRATGGTGMVVVDDDFVSIVRTGVRARLVVGKGEKRIPLSSISGVQWKPAGLVIEGFIQFTLAGGNERRSKFGSQSFDAAKDENSVVFTKGQQPAFEAVRARVEKAVADRGRPQAAATAAAPAAPDLVDQLQRLAGLRDQGVLTEAEFQAKKADLLARM